MANTQNLKPHKLTVEEQRKGGRASVASRKARKTLREELLSLLSDGDTQNRVSVALIEAAIDGDVKAFTALRDTIGEKPVDKIEMTSDIVVDLGDLPDGD